MVWHWCRRRHPQKSFTWFKEKYFQSRLPRVRRGGDRCAEAATLGFVV